jgi:hypothetical protein
VLTVELPLSGVIERLISARELERAARRAATAPPGAERSAEIAHVMTAALREALAGANGFGRRAAVDAIRRARVRELVGDVRALLIVTSDSELRVLAIAAAAELHDVDAAETLLQQLPADLPEHPRLALAEARALVALGRSVDAAGAIRSSLEQAGASPGAVALAALAFTPVPSLAPALARWLAHGDARTRAGVCAAAQGTSLDVAWAWMREGLRDRDATVRARCVDAITAHSSGAVTDRRLAGAIPRLRVLAQDRDRAVRASAITALVALDPSHPERAVDDPAAEVRAAYAAALAIARTGEADSELRALIDDRDADVRAAAWATLAAAPAALADRAQLAARAASDPAAQVRRAALSAVDDDDLLAHLASSDDSPEVRTEALVELTGRRGRVAAEVALLEQLAAAPAGGVERVRPALAWLLAR